MVKTRIQNTYDVMALGKVKYGFICCHNTRGTCETCSGKAMAFVMNENFSTKSKRTNTNVRLCPSLFEGSDKVLGLTLFHEFMHVTSVVFDHATHAYKKKSMV